MLPVLLVGAAAAAFFFSGCTESKNNDTSDAAPPPPANSADAAQDSAETSPPPTPPLKVDIDPKSKAFQIYQQLKEAKVSDAELDQGYHEIDYSRPGPNETEKGKGDGHLDEQELYEYVIDHHDRFQGIVEGIAGKPVPWVLDDKNPATDFDEKIRARVTEATNDIKAALKAQGLDEKSDEFQEKLAVALFYFVDFPEDKGLIQKKEKDLKIRTRELTEMGLSDFQQKLFEKGGLNVSQIKSDGLEEGSALEALKSKKGGVTEKAKILYAVFENAGLKPYFARSRVKDVESTFKANTFRFHWQNRQDYHTFVGINFGNRSRLFDLSFFNSKADYAEYYPLRLTQVVASEINHRGFGFFVTGKGEQALAAFQLAGHLDPKNPLIYNNLGNVLLAINKNDEAKKAIEESVKLDPQFPMGPMNLGNIAFQKGQLDKAVSLFYQATKIDPKYPMAYNNLGAAFLRQGKIDKAIKMAKAAVRLDPENPMFHYNLGLAYKEKGDMAQAEQEIRKAGELDAKQHGVKAK
ncbi:MAG: tetratricopeptide repeat protein [bacterium]